MATNLEATKVCTCCKQLKLKYVDFATVNKKNRPNPQVRPQCRTCRSQQEMARRNQNREEWLSKQAVWRENNKDKIKQYHEAKKEENLQRFKEYRDKNKERIQESKKAYYSKAENKAKRNDKDKQRKRVDDEFRVMCNIRTRVHNVLKQNKTCKTDKLLCCNKEQLKTWLTYQLHDDLDWSNYGTLWHIDHVIPLAFFNLLDQKEQLLAFHWSNLRPLNAVANIDKSDKIIDDYILQHIETFKHFTQENSSYPTNIQNSWCERMILSKGENEQDERDFTSLLKWVISSDYMDTHVTFND